MDIQGKLLKRAVQRTYAYLPGFVLLLTLGTTLLAWHYTRHQAIDEARDEFEHRVTTLQGNILTGMQSYEQMLLAARGLFAASTDVTRADWRHYVEIQHIDEKFPGLLGMGIAVHLRPDDLARHEHQVRAEGFPNYAVWPQGVRSEYSSIIYLEPFSGRNLRAFGYDMLSEPVRREAMLRAQATGQAALSGKIRLVQEGEGKAQAGVLLYVPLSQPIIPLTGASSPTEFATGWAYLPLRMDDLIHSLLPQNKLNLDLSIYDGQVAALLRLYPAESSPATEKPRFTTQRDLPMYGQHWILVANSTPALDSEMATDKPWMVLIGGTIISLLLFAFTQSMARTYTRALTLAKGMTQELSESERRFRDMFENSPIPYQSLDVTGRFIDVNDRLCEMLGYTREELLGMDFDQLWPSENRHNFYPSLLEFQRCGHTEAELTLLRKDGTPLTVIIFGRAQRDAQGNYLRSHCILTDISARKQMEIALHSSQAQLKQAIHAADIGLWDWNLSNNEVYFSPEYKRQIGYEDHELTGSFDEWANRVHPEDLPHALAMVQAHNKEPESYPYQIEFRFRHRDGHYIWIEARGMTLFDEAGLPIRMLGSHMDVTERHRKEQMLNLSKVVFESAEEGILVTDAEQNIVMINPAFSYITGYTSQEVVGKNPRLLSSGHHNQAFYDGLFETLGKSGVWHGEIANRHKNGRLYIEWLSIRAVTSSEGKITHYVGIFSDITERKENEERMRYLAHYDALTGLPNRTLLLDRLQQALAQARRDHGKLALLFLDLDRFKPVNDTLGHEVGDRLLCEVARRLQEHVRESDTVSRIGGDEFIVLLHGMGQDEDALVVAQKIVDALEKPFMQESGPPISITASIGIAFYPEHATDESMLIKMADLAMYEAKAAGAGRYQVYHSALTAN
jgi:diguanylate cyclase (GGDEF)-like protein/PAS domain S-box-containing protein